MLQDMAQVMQICIKLVVLLDYVNDFDFVLHLHFMLLILGHENVLYLYIQRKYKGILEAIVEVKLTKKKNQQIRDDGWEYLLERTYSFCQEHGVPKLDMKEDYIDRHRPRKKDKLHYKDEHYRYDFLNLVTDW